MLWQESKKENKNFMLNKLVVVVILSLVIGSFAGGVTSLMIWQNIDKFGFVFENEDGRKIQNIETEKITLLEEESATIDVVKRVRPSVVSILITKELKNIYNSTGPNNLEDLFEFGWPFGFRFEQPEQPDVAPGQKTEVGGGTGFIVSSDGLILTNKHVVLDEEAEYTVITNDGQTYQAQVLAKDSINDLALLKIEADNLTPLGLGDSDNIEIGQTVIAIGNTLSEFRNTVTKGVISGVGRRVEAGGSFGFSEVIEQAIQTDAAINPGNSGGPLVNLKGEVIGINTAISGSGQLIGFSIPINEAKKVIESVTKYGKIVRPFLGVRYTIINKKIAEVNELPVDYGALIIKGKTAEELAVIPGSSADNAGLEANDIILEVNGQQIDNNNSLGRILAQFNPGDEVELKILHDGQEKTVKVILEERA
jgi:serine protease Do